MTSITNREEYVKNYQLSKSEYCLMPRIMRLTYGDLLYRQKVERAKEKGVICEIGYIQEPYIEYFKACGCKLTNYDFETEEYEIQSIYNNDFIPTEEEKELVLEYVKTVAEIRWTIYETAVKDALYNELANLSRGNMIDKNFSVEKFSKILTEDVYSNKLSDEQKELIDAELASYINSEQEFEMSAWISQPYIEELKAKGYTISENEDSIIAKILK